ncbi:MAG: hypothetical protein CR972_04115 [Candidatus Moraniibacteriota bacterium]|nr:MAG: hypothetical protein CR972_04115 [Candidatus Moranbacteria bacterium]
MSEKKNSIKKATDTANEIASAMSHGHTLLSFVKSFLGLSQGSKSAESAGLQASASGKGKADERLFFTACARAEERLIREFKYHENDAKRRIHNIQKERDALDPITDEAVILTIGLEQTKNAQGIFQNIDGQDIIIMLAKHDDRNFTQMCFKAMARSNEVLPYRLKQIEEKVKEFNDATEKFFKDSTYETRRGVFWDFVPIVNLFTTRRKK